MRALFALAALCAAFASPAQADEPLAPLQFFQGCWRGAFAGSSVTDDRCFAPMLGGAYVRDTHDVRGAPGPYSGETVYWFDPTERRIAYIYFASDGGVMRGFGTAENGVLTFPAAPYVGADGSVLILRGVWRPDGPDRYLAISEIEQNGAWVEHLRIAYVRAPDLTPPRP